MVIANRINKGKVSYSWILKVKKINKCNNAEFELTHKFGTLT